tara:strand:- start:2327 stop:2566 length:240 start_codon:yes stop_codon:yes gene_type:complete
MPTFKHPIKMSTALKIARRRVFSDGAQLLTERDDGQMWASEMSLDCQGTRALQVRNAVARARRRYAEQLVYRSENPELY